MSNTSIRISDATRTRLDFLRREDESYDDVIGRLTRRDRWAGFGVLADADPDTREGLARMRREPGGARYGTVDAGRNGGVE